MSRAPVGEVLVGEDLEGTHDPPQVSLGNSALGKAPGRPSSSFFPLSWRRLKHRWRLGQSQDLTGLGDGPAPDCGVVDQVE